MSRLSRFIRNGRSPRAAQVPHAPAQPGPPSYHRRTTWWRNAEWLETYDRYIRPDNFTGEHHHRILDRRFTLQQLARSVRNLRGSTAECGVFKGIGSALICATLADTYRDGELHFGFDSFRGLPAPGNNDAAWQEGQLATPLDDTRAHLAEFDCCELRVGWIPQTFSGLEDRRYRLIHIDVDLEETTRHCMEFFYERAVPGAVFVFDDYGFASCPGARNSIREFMDEKPEPIVELTTGQAFFYRR